MLYYTHSRSSFKKHEQQAPNFGCGSIGWQNWWLSVVADTFKGAGSPADEKTLNTVGYHLIKHFSSRNAYELFDGSLPFLETVRSRSVKTGVISNTDDRLEGILVQLGIRHYFDFVITSYSAKFAKPDPRIFQQALDITGCNISPSEALHIGDNLQHDYLGARESGWLSFLVARDYQQLCEKNGVTLNRSSMFTSLQELIPIIEKSLQEETS